MSLCVAGSPPVQADREEPLLGGSDRRDLAEQEAAAGKAGAAQGEPTGLADSGKLHLVCPQSSVHNAFSCIDYFLYTPSCYLKAENAHHYPWVYWISSSILLSRRLEHCCAPRKAEVLIATGL